MEAIKPNDDIYCDFGYGVVVDVLHREPNLDDLPDLALYRGESKVGMVEPTAIDDEQIVEIKLSWGGRAFIQVKKLTKFINLKIKIFYEERKLVDLIVPINYTIVDVYKSLEKQMGETLQGTFDCQLFYPMGTIQHLNSASKTMKDYQLPNNAKLLLLVKKAFHWSLKSVALCTNLELLNNNNTVKIVQAENRKKNRMGNCITVVGDTLISEGKRYWSIKIDKLHRRDESFTIGICTDKFDQNETPTNSDDYWGYQPVFSQYFNANKSHEYGKTCGQGDTVGVCLEFKNKCGTLSFYKNGHFLGDAATDLIGSFLPAVTFFALDSQITLHNSPKPLSK